MIKKLNKLFENILIILTRINKVEIMEEIRKLTIISYILKGEDDFWLT